MPRRPPRAVPVTSLRILLVALFALFLGGLLALYHFGRAGRQPVPQPPPAEELEGEDQELLVEAEGFGYEITVGNRTVGRVRGERMLSDQKDRVILEQMAVTILRQGGGTYHVASLKGTYDFASQATNLEGEVVLRDERGAVLWADQMDYDGREVTSQGAVRFRLGEGLAGRADSVWADLREDVFRLRGSATVERIAATEPPARLTADEIVYERQAARLRATGNVVVEQGGDRLEARRLSVLLTEDGGDVRFIQGRWDVVMRFAGFTRESLASELRVVAGSFALPVDPATRLPQRIELQAAGAAPVSVVSREAGGIERRLTSPYVTGTFRGGDLRHLVAVGPVHIVEALAPGPGLLLREACAWRADAEIGPDGGLERVVLRDAVEVRDDGFDILSAQAKLELPGGDAHLEGDPVLAVGPRGELEAPDVIRSAASGNLVATGGVRLRLPARSGGAVSLDGDQGPVRIEAGEAMLDEATGDFRLRDDVRAWQAQSLLLAPEIRSEGGGVRILATGGVRTVRRPTPGEALDPESQDAQPIEVTAEEMLYAKGERTVEYSGGEEGLALGRQGGRSVSCKNLRVRLSESGRAEELHCQGEARVHDPANGRTVSGEVAVYRLDSGLVEVEGEPAVLKDEDGTEIQGARMLYDFRLGTSHMEGVEVPEEDAEAADEATATQEAGSAAEGEASPEGESGAAVAGEAAPAEPGAADGAAEREVEPAGEESAPAGEQEPPPALPGAPS